MRTAILALALAVLALACAAGPAAAAPVRVGVSEQDLGVFADPNFQALRVKRMRGFAPWNVAQSPGDRAYLDQWLGAARARGIEPLITFTATAGDRCPESPCRLPSVSAYRKAFRAFRKRWPWVRSVSPWNEANHRTQPTFRSPKRAAQYFNVVRAACRACRIVAADVLDDPNMERWLRAFKRHARRPRIWGLHNYRDTNPRRNQRYGGTRRLLKAVKGEMWLTETGGIVKFQLPGGKALFPASEGRADRAIRRLLSIAGRYRTRIRRLYVYHWRQPAGPTRFDAGLVRADGQPRPAYFTLRRHLRGRVFSP